MHEYRVQLQATSLCQTNEQVWTSVHSMASLLTSLLCYFNRLEPNLHLHIKWQVHNCSFDLEPALMFCHILRHHASCPTVTEPISKQENCVLIALSVQQQCWGFEQIPFKRRDQREYCLSVHTLFVRQRVLGLTNSSGMFSFSYLIMFATLMLLFEHLWCFC